MKPSVIVQSHSSVPNLQNEYPFLDKLAIIAPRDGADVFAKQLDTWVSFKFNGTLDCCFHDEFLKLFSVQNGPVVCSTSGTPHISFAISRDGRLSLALSRDLDQCTGLEASKPLYDSTVFDASTRLLEINLAELPNLKGKSERIRRNAKRLAEPKWLLECVAVCPKEHAETVRQSLAASGCTVAAPASPFSCKMAALPDSFAIPSEIEWTDKDELWEYFEWCSWALCVCGAMPADLFRSTKWTPSCASMQAISGMMALEVSSALLPPISFDFDFVLASGRAAQTSPPSSALNAQREAHFRPKSFDSSASTADDQAFVLARQKGSNTLVSFKLNRTA